ncbi:MAG: GNAT family N-acetyltransferase [Gammaproteobacteria bacterium]|nr:GNAT family N-acetyltransferase [Gammaproteobacteria bacterium]
MAADLKHRHVERVTVRASHSSVPTNEKSGFVVTGPPGELQAIQGLNYVPMELICDS